MPERLPEKDETFICPMCFDAQAPSPSYHPPLPHPAYPTLPRETAELSPTPWLMLPSYHPSVRHLVITPIYSG